MTKTNLTPQQILALPMQQPNDANAKTIYQYIHALAHTVWVEGEGFSGKRPFGNSGWYLDLHIPLVKADLIRGQVNEYGSLEESDDNAADEIIDSLFKFLKNADPLSFSLPPEPKEHWVARLIVDDGSENWGPALWGPFTEKDAKVQLSDKQALLPNLPYKVVHIPL